MKPWDRLEAIDEEERQLLKRLREIRDERPVLRQQCIMALGKIKGDVLCRREMEVLELLRLHPGLSNKEIGIRMNITERTVKFHMSNILAKYGVFRRSELLGALNAA